MLAREKLKGAIEQAIVPFATETSGDDDTTNDSFVVETAEFLTQQLIDNGIEIIDEQAELDDEDLENLKICQLLISWPLASTNFSPQRTPCRLFQHNTTIYFTRTWSGKASTFTQWPM